MGGCFPLNNKHSVKEFFSPLQKSRVGTKLNSYFLSYLKFSFLEKAKIREFTLIGFSSEVYASFTDSHHQFRERSNITHT